MRAISVVNVRFIATTILLAPTANAAISAPSSTRYGSRRRIMRSLNEPGSPSAAFTTTVVGSASEALAATVCHLRPVGNPAPPRPRSPDDATASITDAGPSLAAARIPRSAPASTASVREANGLGARTRHSLAMQRTPP